MTINSMLQLAAECAFEHSGELNMRFLRTEPTVRDMCAANYNLYLLRADECILSRNTKDRLHMILQKKRNDRRLFEQVSAIIS